MRDERLAECRKYSVFGGCCTQCELMILTWNDRQGELTFVWSSDGRVENKKETDQMKSAISS